MIDEMWFDEKLVRKTGKEIQISKKAAGWESFLFRNSNQGWNKIT